MGHSSHRRNRLLSGQKSPRRVKTYAASARSLPKLPLDHDMPDDIGQVTSEHIRAFLAAERERTSPAFAQHHKNPEVVKPFFTQAEITALLRACIG